MPTSSEAVTGIYQPTLVPDQKYNRLEREETNSQEIRNDVEQIQEIPSVEKPVVKLNWIKIISIVSLISIAIVCAGVLPAVIISQVISQTTTTISTDTTTVSGGTTVVVSSGSSSVTSQSSSSATTSNCGSFTCSYLTGYSLTSSGYYGTEQVNISCTHPLSNFTGSITVLTSRGATYAQQYNTFWSNTVTQSNSSTVSQIVYSWNIIPGQTIAVGAFPVYIQAQFQLTGSNQTVTSDSYSVVVKSACTGQVLSQTGFF